MSEHDAVWTWTRLIHNYHRDLWDTQNKLYTYRRDKAEAEHQIPILEAKVERLTKSIEDCVEGLVKDATKEKAAPG